MSYYRTIEGQRYDQDMLLAAEQLVKGAGDGRISQADAQKLLDMAHDGGGITEIEKSTLRYIQENFAWTEKAKNWFREQVDLAEPKGNPETWTKIVNKEFKLTGLKLTLDPQEVENQLSQTQGVISFEQALREALLSFLFNEDGSEAPRVNVREVHQIFPEKFDSPEAAARALDTKVKEYMRKGEIGLIPLQFPDEESDFPFFPPKVAKAQNKTGFSASACLPSPITSTGR
ncbi:MAG: hypothetical protein HC880_06510 [Bacteroidia bacterium]|nr:hypothetical protein [Bacteroidia bacterium]